MTVWQLGVLRCSLVVGICVVPPPVFAGHQDRGLSISPSESRRMAFVVGNNAYQAAPLRNAVNDARDMGVLLRELKFAVTTVLDAKTSDLESELRSFVGALRPGDVALFYFAGHGIQIERENYLLPIDFPPDLGGREADDAKARAISVSNVIDRMKARQTAVRLVILDACRTNPFRGLRSAAGGLAPMKALGTLVAYATAPDTTASDDPAGKNGLYTGQLLELMRVPGIEARELFVRVKQRVYQASDERQIPWYEDGLIGDFVFRPTAATETSRPVSDQAKREEVFWQQIKDRADRKGFEEYLRVFGPESRYAAMARLQLRVLEKQIGYDATTQTRRPSVGILGFRNLRARSEADWISTALTDQLATELAAGDQLLILPGETVSQVKSELALPEAEAFGKDTLTRIRSNLNADLVLLGSFDASSEQDGRIRVDVRLQPTTRGDTLIRISESGTERDFEGLIRRITASLRASLGLQSAQQAQSLGGASPSSPRTPEAMRAYYEGLARLRVFDAIGAREYLQKATAIEPNFPLAHAALANAWSELGYDTEAARQADQARQLSADLPRATRLLIEARAWEAHREWAKAAEAYQTLADFYPDDPDYVLALARSRLRGGGINQAEDVIARTSKSGHLPSEDPRFDLVLADVAQARGDFRQMLARAQTAADSGTLKGAWLVVARASVLEAWALLNLGRLPEAREKNATARALYLSAGNRIGVSRALLQFGALARRNGNLDEAADAFGSALAITRELGEQDLIARNLTSLGNVHFDRGDLAQAKAAYTEALRTYQSLGQPRATAMLMNNVASVLYEEGNTEEALLLDQRSLALKREMKNEAGIIVSLQNIGETLSDRGELDQAIAHYQESLQLSRSASARSDEAHALYGLARVQLRRGNVGEAKLLHEQALALRKELAEGGSIAESQLAIAELLVATGQLDEAKRLVTAALATFRSAKRVDDQARAHTLMTQVHLREGSLELAANDLQLAGALAGNTRRREVRLMLLIARFRLDLRRDGSSNLEPELDRVLQELLNAQMHALAFEVRLALAEGALRRQRDQSSEQFAFVLEREAAAAGFGLVAARARELRLRRQTPGDQHRGAQPMFAGGETQNSATIRRSLATCQGRLGLERRTNRIRLMDHQGVGFVPSSTAICLGFSERDT